MHGFTSRGSFVADGIKASEGRFGRLLPVLDARQPTGSGPAEALGASGGPMDAGIDDAKNETTGLAAGFTFLAQFLDHDLDFDPTSSLERQVDPAAVLNFRTPAFDLDNIYGAGPSASPQIYDQSDESAGAKLFVNGNDLGRSPQGTALIGDPRNDENMLISQLQVGFMKCHNAIVDGLRAGTFHDVFGAPARTNRDDDGGENTDFLAAQQLMRWHYQWMIVHEFLPTICDPDVVEDVIANGPRFYAPSDARLPFIPVEFSVAAYRFGHATVRSKYKINAAKTLALFPTDPNASKTIRTDCRGGAVAPEFAVDWTNFFDFGGSKAQRARRIAPLLNTLLLDLPTGVIPKNIPPARRSLATRNLLRSEALMVPSGQDVARALDVEDVLSVAQLRAVAKNAGNKTLPQGDEELASVYLWYYLLAEAFEQSGGERMGEAGSRIIAEVFVGILTADALSYMNMFPRWKPTLPSAKAGDFTITDFLTLAGVVTRVLEPA